MMRLKKICGSHPTCNVAIKCLNFRERVEVAERNKTWFYPVNTQCL